GARRGGGARRRGLGARARDGGGRAVLRPTRASCDAPRGARATAARDPHTDELHGADAQPARRAAPDDRRLRSRARGHARGRARAAPARTRARRAPAPLGSERALVVHGSDGLDEITITGPTHAALLENGAVRELAIYPQTLGVPLAPGEALRGGDAAENAKIAFAVLEGEEGPRRDVVLLNAAAVIWTAGAAAHTA